MPHDYRNESYLFSGAPKKSRHETMFEKNYHSGMQMPARNIQMAQMPNRHGNMNDSKMSPDVTDMPRQGIMQMVPKGSKPHGRMAMYYGEPSTSGTMNTLKGTSKGVTGIVRNSNKGLLMTPSYDTKSKNTGYMNKRFSFEGA